MRSSDLRAAAGVPGDRHDHRDVVGAWALAGSGHHARGGWLDACNLRTRESYNRSREGWITTTRLNGQRALRVTIMNLLISQEHWARLIGGLAALGNRARRS
jgi:hypothetical protein